MAILQLGTRTIDIEDGWVVFDSFTLNKDDRYLVSLSFNSLRPHLVYSTFELKIGYSLKNGSFSYMYPITSFDYNEEPIGVVLDIPKRVEDDEDMLIAIRRISFYTQPSELASMQITAIIDDNVVLD